MQRGDLQRAALVESTELFLHPWTLGTLGLVRERETLFKGDADLIQGAVGACACIKSSTGAGR